MASQRETQRGTDEQEAQRIRREIEETRQRGGDENEAERIRREIEEKQDQ